jgi:hypothetical protein
MKFGDFKGACCLIVLKVKYAKEKDWIVQRLWMIPGWEQQDIWQKAYKWIWKDIKKRDYLISEIEEAKFDSFKLV